MTYDNISLDGKVVFYEKGHKYVHLDYPGLKFKSVTTFLKNFYEPFDSTTIATRVSLDEKSIYYGMTVDEILGMWSQKAVRGSGEGTILHSYGESIWNNQEVVAPALAKAHWVPMAIKEIKDTFGYELAKVELLVYSESLKIAGQSDMILKKKWSGDEDYSYAVYDWKFLSKELEKKSFFNAKTRKYKKMLHPFHHLLDCNWIHYSIQLAIYQTLTGDPAKIKEKVLVVVYDDRFEFVPCYPMRIFWDTNNNLQAVYETHDGKYYDSRIDKILTTWPADITGR